MMLAEALRIVQALADGQNPISGDRLPDGSPYQHPDIVRALFTAVQALSSTTQRTVRTGSVPINRGQPWTAIEDKQLCDAFDARTSITNLAKLHQRSIGAIKSRLERLGKEVPQPTQSVTQYPSYIPRTEAKPNDRNA